MSLLTERATVDGTNYKHGAPPEHKTKYLRLLRVYRGAGIVRTKL
jgi:hypothetical protein